MRQDAAGRLIVLGKVLRPHGLGGLLRVHAYTASETSFSALEALYLRTAEGVLNLHRVEAVQPQKRHLLVKLEGISSRTAADAYRGADILAPKEALAREDDEYFWHELTGLEVYLEDGTHLGRLAAIIPTAGHDIYVVAGRQGDVLIPATHEHVREIAVERGRMVVALDEELLKLNAV